MCLSRYWFEALGEQNGPRTPQAVQSVTIYRATEWANNSEMIKEVASLGYIEGAVLDCTFGKGNFWKLYQPEDFTACDLVEHKSPIGYSVDFTKMPFEDDSFDTVVLDGPYKLNGTPSEKEDEAYGVHIPATWQERHDLIKAGMSECARVSRNRVLVKCQDQVSLHHIRWQTLSFPVHAFMIGLAYEDRFDLVREPRQQPKFKKAKIDKKTGEKLPREPMTQSHVHSNYSTLLVFSKKLFKEGQQQ